MSNCKQCGTCCQKGGPALHLEDINLISSGLLKKNNLVTIRKGEPLFSPISDQAEPAKQDILKISGPHSWTCTFYNEKAKHCTIYEQRPLECRLLKCWDPKDLTDIIYKHNISRWDIEDIDPTIIEAMKTHEEVCGFPNFNSLVEDGRNQQMEKVLPKLTEIIVKDLSIREATIKQYNLSLPEEIFYFGRPMFKSLQFYALKVNQQMQVECV